MTEEQKTTATQNIYKPGMVVKVHQKIKETNTKGEEKERIQIFEGTVLATRHNLERGATITVYKTSEGVGVEKIFPIYSPAVAKIEIVKQLKVKSARVDYLTNPEFKRKVKEVKTAKVAKTK